MVTFIIFFPVARWRTARQQKSRIFMQHGNNGDFDSFNAQSKSAKDSKGTARTLIHYTVNRLLKLLKTYYIVPGLGRIASRSSIVTGSKRNMLFLPCFVHLHLGCRLTILNKSIEL